MKNCFADVMIERLLQIYKEKAYLTIQGLVQSEAFKDIAWESERTVNFFKKNWFNSYWRNGGDATLETNYISFILVLVKSFKFFKLSDYFRK